VGGRLAGFSRLRFSANLPRPILQLCSILLLQGNLEVKVTLIPPPNILDTSIALNVPPELPLHPITQKSIDLCVTGDRLHYFCTVTIFLHIPCLPDLSLKGFAFDVSWQASQPSSRAHQSRFGTCRQHWIFPEYWRECNNTS
jgi:hypothetical protein